MPFRSYGCALGGSHDDVVLVNRGLGWALIGERDAAMNDLSAAIVINPHASHAHFNRGNLNRFHGDLPAARRDYESGQTISVS